MKIWENTHDATETLLLVHFVLSNDDDDEDRKGVKPKPLNQCPSNGTIFATRESHTRTYFTHTHHTCNSQRRIARKEPSAKVAHGKQQQQHTILGNFDCAKDVRSNKKYAIAHQFKHCSKECISIFNFCLLLWFLGITLEWRKGSGKGTIYKNYTINTHYFDMMRNCRNYCALLMAQISHIMGFWMMKWRVVIGCQLWAINFLCVLWIDIIVAFIKKK